MLLLQVGKAKWHKSSSIYNNKQVALIHSDWLRLIVYKLDDSYFLTFASLSESDCSQSELDHYCLETGCLPPGDLWRHFYIKVAQMLRVLHTQPLGEYFIVVATCNQLHKKKEIYRNRSVCQCNHQLPNHFYCDWAFTWRKRSTMWQILTHHLFLSK